MTAQTRPNSDPPWAQLRAQTIQPPGDRLYADWTASGRLYRPIEERLTGIAGPWMANSHTEDSLTGRAMTQALGEAEERVRTAIGASVEDVVLLTGNGMTGALAKLIRLLGLWVHEDHRAAVRDAGAARPVVFVSHMEHHSNQTLWLETRAEVRVIPPTTAGEVDLDWLAAELDDLAPERARYASVTAASNVTGVAAPYRAIARLLHQAGGHCFVDFACAAPYVEVDMHPPGEEPLDAVFFSPHKFLGGPGASGVLAFNRALYHNRVPDQPGGGTVVWTNPWGEHRFIGDIAAREAGGTPGILQGIKAALALDLKAAIGVPALAEREAALTRYFLDGLAGIEGVHLLAADQRDRLAVFSVVIDGLPYPQAVRRLSHDHGIEARGGCACAGTYGHYLLGIDREESRRITDRLDAGDASAKPGWVRLSFHPMMPLADLDRVLAALAALAADPDRPPGEAQADMAGLWAPFFS